MNIRELRNNFNVYDENLKREYFLKKLEYLYNSINPNSKLLMKLCILDVLYNRQSRESLIFENTESTGVQD